MNTKQILWIIMSLSFITQAGYSFYNHQDIQEWFAFKKYEPLAKTLTDDEDATRRSEAAKALSELAEKAPADVIKNALSALTKALGDPNDNVRWNASSAIATLAKSNADKVQTESLDALVTLLKDNLAYVRSNALIALWSIASINPKAVKEKAMTDVVNNLSNNQKIVRWSAGLVLRELVKTYPEEVNQAALAILINALKDSCEEMREVSAVILMEIARTIPQNLLRTGLPSLLAGLKDEKIKNIVATTLAYLAEEGSNQVVEAGLDHCLKAINAPNASDLIRINISWIFVNLSLNYPNQVNSSIQDTLKQLLKDGHSEVKQHAILSLALLQHQDVYEQTVSIAKTSNDSVFRQLALTALSRYNSPDAKQIISHIAANDADSSIKQFANSLMKQP